MVAPRRGWPKAAFLILALLGCNQRRPGDVAGDAAATDASAEPILASQYATTWGDVGWHERKFNTITFTDQGQTKFLRLTVANSPEIAVEWSRENPAADGGWDRGRAKLTMQPDRTLSGTWGHGDSRDDGGAFEMLPPPRD